MFRFRFDQYLALFLVSLLFLVPVSKAQTQEKILPPVELAAVHPIPTLPSTASPSQFTATFSAQAVVAIDVDSASILLDKNSHQKLAPASTTKIMTALVAVDTFSLDQVIAVKKDPGNIGHIIGFKLGEQFTVHDMLKALLINSGNDAAEILAQNHPQGRAAFIQAMNAKAQQLHLSESSFVNPSGLDAAAHYSSAFDLSLLARELMKNEYLRTLVGTTQAAISDQTGKSSYQFYNTNQLLGVEPGVVGVKTGTTELAGEDLITQVERDGRHIIIVVLKSQNRYRDTRQIISWLFSHYQWLDF